jgi:hypothetical protein
MPKNASVKSDANNPHFGFFSYISHPIIYLESRKGISPQDSSMNTLDKVFFIKLMEKHVDDKDYRHSPRA